MNSQESFLKLARAIYIYINAYNKVFDDLIVFKESFLRKGGD